jgi:hypothetical protein
MPQLVDMYSPQKITLLKLREFFTPKSAPDFIAICKRFPLPDCKMHVSSLLWLAQISFLRGNSQIVFTAWHQLNIGSG